MAKNLFFARLLAISVLLLILPVANAATRLQPILDKTTGCLVYVDTNRPQCNPTSGTAGQTLEYVFELPSNVNGDLNFAVLGNTWIQTDDCQSYRSLFDSKLNGYANYRFLPPKNVLNLNGENKFSMFARDYGLRSFQICIYSPRLSIQTTSTLPDQVKTGDQIQIEGLVQNTGDIDAKGVKIGVSSPDFNVQPDNYAVDLLNQGSGDAQKKFSFTLTPIKSREANYALNGIDFGQITATYQGHVISNMSLGTRPYSQVTSTPPAPSPVNSKPSPSIPTGTNGPATNDSSGMTLIFGILIGMVIVALLVGAGYYFLVYQKKGAEQEKKEKKK